MAKILWMTKWPTKPGSYWFYGWRFGYSEHDPAPELSFVEVWLDGAKNLAYVTRGHFFYKSEGAMGFWAPVDIPTLPENELKILKEIAE